jgi:hypothetical protein
MSRAKKKRINAMRRKQTERNVRCVVRALTSPPMVTAYAVFAYEMALELLEPDHDEKTEPVPPSVWDDETPCPF